MEHFLKKEVQKLLKKYGIYPSKRFGQNFLIDKRVLRKIMAAADCQSKDVILEIGPGTGVLTQELAKRVKPARQSAGASRQLAGGKVIAVEKDPKMIEILKKTTRNLKNVKIIQGNILKIRHSAFNIQRSYKVVANLPYYIASSVIRKFLESKNRPSLMILMVQKEVAQRIVARPPDMNLLAVSIQFYAKPEIVSYVSKKSFWPQPQVDGAILKIIPRKSALLSASLRFYFFKIVKAGFSQPRKQLINNLAKILKIDRQKIKIWLQKNKIQPNQRAETLSIANWIQLAKTLPSFSLKVK